MQNSPIETNSDEKSESIVSNQSHDVLFIGDQGTLPVETRRVLVQLLLGPALDARRQTKLWPILLRDESSIRSRLHDLFLELVIDRDLEVAFTRQVVSDELDVPILLRRTQLTFLDSLLLLFLRQRLTQSDAQAERAVLAHQEMVDHMTIFQRRGDVDHARFGKQIANAIEKAKRLSLLQKIRDSDDRYEVSPTLKLLFPAEEIQALARVYAELASSSANANMDDVESPSETDDEAASQ
ncbi:MAG: DUF4194 domain-containing protein [Candidatus Acidiferrum sp.]